MALLTPPPFLTGQFLLAMPGLTDPHFEKAVIAMCVHDADGALGLCVHAVVPDLNTRDLMEEQGLDPGAMPAAPVYAGGPVDVGRGLVLHSTDWSGAETRYVGSRWAITTSQDVLVSVAHGGGPKDWLVALGYAGWSAGQLEAELNGNSWFATQGDDSILWAHQAHDRWANAFLGAGINPIYLSASSGSA